METATLPTSTSTKNGSYIPVIQYQDALKAAIGDFDPAKHLAFKEPEKIYTMSKWSLFPHLWWKHSE